MARATQAILKHYSSSIENPWHGDCPEGPSSWCSYQHNIADGTNLHKPIKNPLPDAVVEVIKPLFNRLGAETFLAGCEECYTQNRNECLHHVIWGMASKEVYSSPQEISIAISLGVLQFNWGYSATYADLPCLGIQVLPQMQETWKKIDAERIYQSDYRSSSEVKRPQKQKRKEKMKKQDPFIHEEGITYQSQAFRGGEENAGKKGKNGRKPPGKPKEKGKKKRGSRTKK